MRLWRLRARWSLLDVVQSVSLTKFDCLSAFLIDSVIFIFFSCEYCAFYIYFFITFSSVLEQADLSEIEGVISGNSTWPYLVLCVFFFCVYINFRAC